jgi:PAS domain S-box-containing protein
MERHPHSSHGHAAADEESFRFLVEGVTDYAIFMLDTDGRVLTWNAGARRIKQYDDDEIIGQHFSVFYTPEDRSVGKAERELAIARNSGRYEEEGWRVRKDGTRFWANVVLTALRDEEGELRGYAKITRDLTERRAATDQLRASEERLRLLLENITDYAVFMLDVDGRVATWSRGAEKITGWRAEDVLGRPVSAFYTAEDKLVGKASLEMRTAIEVGRFEDEGWRVRRDGSRYWANVVVAVIRDGRNEVVGFAKVVRDLSDRRRTEEQLRQSEQKLRLLIDSVRDYAIFMLDPSGHVATWNRGARRIKGYAADEIIGQHFSVFYPVDDVRAGKCDLELRVAAETGRFEDEGWRVRKDGTRFWANVVISAVRDDHGRLIGFSMITRDLTERRRSEEERLRLAQAHEAVRLRDEFLSIASHELKTPLTSLQLQVGGLRRSVARLDRSQLEKRTEVVERQVERLTSLVNNLLDVSRAASGTMQLDLSDVDLDELVDEVAARHSEELRAVGSVLNLDVRRPCNGHWDRMRLDQVITNLVSNAIKYGGGKPIDLFAHCTEDHAIIIVRDRGIGISVEDRERIFERFARAVSAEHYGGLGLGLWIVKELVTAMSGTVHADSPADGGARFVVQLPRF